MINIFTAGNQRGRACALKRFGAQAWQFCPIII
jgi:hypothetical protein